jgi:hypothetical protein
MLMFGIDKSRFLNIPEKVKEDTLTFKAYVENRVQHIIQMYDTAYRNLEIAQERQNVEAMKKAKVRNVYIGQRVFLELGKKVMGKSQYVGPFRIIKKVNNYVYEIHDIENPRLKPCRVSIDRLYEIEDRKEHLQIGETIVEDEQEIEIMPEKEGVYPKIGIAVENGEENKNYPGVLIVNVPYPVQNNDISMGQTSNQNVQDMIQEAENITDQENIPSPVSMNEINQCQNADRIVDKVRNDPLPNMNSGIIAKLRENIRTKMAQNTAKNGISKVKHNYNLRRRK